MRRGWLIGLGVALLLAAALAGGLAWVVASKAGLRWAVAIAQDYAPVTIHFESLDGRLIGPIDVTGLRVRTDTVTVRLDSGHLAWRPLRLVRGRVAIAAIRAEGIDVETAVPTGAEAAPQPPAAPKLPEDWVPPIELAIDEAAFEGIRVRVPGTTVVVDRIAFGLRVDAGGGRIDGLAIESPQGDIRGDLQLGAQAPFQLGGSLSWRVDAPVDELAPMAGRLTLGGNLRAPAGQLRWDEPATAALDWRVRPFDDELSWRADVRLPETDLQRWWSAAPGWGAGADMALRGSLDRVQADGELTVVGLPTGRLDARLALAADSERMTLERLEVRPAARPDARARLRGDVAWASGEPVLDLVADWQALTWPLDTDPEVRSADGRLRLEGRPEDYRLDGRASLASRLVERGPAQLEWAIQGSMAAAERFDVRAHWQEASLQATGAARWADNRHARTRLSFEGVDPARLGGGARGDIAGAVEIEATETEAGWRGQAELAALRGVVAERPVTGTGRVRFDDAEWSIDRMVLRAGDAALSADGRLGEQSDFEWRLQVPELGQLVEGYRGRIDGNGTVTGSLQRPRVRIDVAAEGMEGAEFELDALRLQGEAVLGDEAVSNVRLVASGLRGRDWALEGVDARLRGEPGEHTLDAEVRHERASVNAEFTGALAGSDWRGMLNAGRIQVDERTPWRLASPQPLEWVDGAFEAQSGCWRNDGARVCLEGRFAGGRFRAGLDATGVPIGLLGAYWREDLDYTGALDLRADLASNGGPITGDAVVETTAGQIDGLIEGEPETLFAFGAGKAKLALEPERVTTTVDWPLTGGDRLSGRVAVGRTAPFTLAGEIDARVGQLGLVPVLVPSIGKVEGRLIADLGLSGSVEQPEFSGQMRLDSGAVTVVPLGLRLTALQANVATGSDGADMRLRASSGEGRLQLIARASRDGDGQWQGSGSIQGEGFQAADRSDVELTVSPYLEWRLADREVNVTGSVRVPRARIAPRDLSGAVRPSPDAVVVTRSQQPGSGGTDQAEWRVSADVAVVPGDDVHLDAFGLKGRLAGSLRLIERPGQATVALGELKVEDGTYTIYRQTLAIERGRVIYSGGPVGNPGLDVRATRRPRNVLVGVNVRGTLQDPRIELFSEPPMPESQQLSYLIVGMPVGETSSSEGETLAAAAAFLAKSDQASQIAARVGIDELEVEAGGPGEGSSIVLGRYLSPRLYIGYGIGLLEEANSVRMRYEFSELWSLQGRSGATSSADLLYTIEVDASADAVPPVLKAPSGKTDAKEGE